MTDVLVINATEVLLESSDAELLTEQVVSIEILETAEQGPPGPPGGGVTLLGKLANLAALPATGDLGDLYIIEAEANHGYVWDGAAWTDTGPIQGPQGEIGPAGAAGNSGSDGADGADGASAYAVAVANGFIGTQPQWLASLVGAAGAAGAAGSNGIDGQDGASAYEVAVANGFVGTEAAWLASLVGPTGAAGAAGSDGADGQSAYELALVDGFVGTLAQWLDSLVGPTGATGSAGSNGVDGNDGATGVGVPVGGTAGQVLAKTSSTNYATAWVDPASGGGSGTVTSVAVSVPTGLSVSGSPITASGTIAISYSAGYSIPTNAKQSEWDTAHGWGDHASAGYLNGASIGVSVQAYAANLTSWSALAPAAKQDALVSATNIKTINGTSLLGSGNITVSGGGVTVSDTAPGSPSEGDQWYDTTSGIQYTRVGTSWAQPV